MSLLSEVPARKIWPIETAQSWHNSAGRLRTGHVGGTKHDDDQGDHDEQSDDLATHLRRRP